MADDKTDISTFINLKVMNQAGNILQFKIKKHTQLKKLMNNYCERTGLVRRTIRFRFDGLVVHEADTPYSLNLEENDIIEIFQHQSGGSFYLNYY